MESNPPATLPLATAIPVTSEKDLYHAPLTQAVNAVYLDRRELRARHDFGALTEYLNFKYREGGLSDARELASHTVVLDARAAERFASGTNGVVQEAAAQCLRDMYAIEGEGYGEVGLHFHHSPAPAFTHRNPSRESIFCNFTHAPLTAVMPEQLECVEMDEGGGFLLRGVFSRAKREARDNPERRARIMEMVAATIEVHGGALCVPPDAEGLTVEPADLLRFAGERHQMALALWHEHRVSATPALSFQAHR